MRNTATVGRRGASSWTLEVTAATGHSSGIFKESAGSGAIFETSRILNEFYEKLRGEKYLTFNPSIIVGGTTVDYKYPDGSASGKSNVIPAKVMVHPPTRRSIKPLLFANRWPFPNGRSQDTTALKMCG